LQFFRSRGKKGRTHYAKNYTRLCWHYKRNSLITYRNEDASNSRCRWNETRNLYPIRLPNKSYGLRYKQMETNAQKLLRFVYIS